MTVENQTYKVSANGNDVATVFSFSPMVIFESTDLLVTIVDADGNETELTEGTGTTNYSVSVSEYPGTGSITYPASGSTNILATGEKITIKRVLTLEQQTDLQNQGGYLPDVQETALDKLVMIALQQQEFIDRAFKLAVTVSTDFDTELPANIAANPGLGVIVNATGDGLTLGSLASTTVDAFWTDVVAQSTLAASVTELGGAQAVNNAISKKGADVASAAALTLGSDGNYFDITGTTAITSIGTLGVGSIVRLHFDGALTLTHHATDLILPGASNIVTTAGDEATFVEYASGDWRCISYTKSDGTYLNTGMKLINVQTASADSAIYVSLPSGYETFLWLLSGVMPSADGDSAYIRMSSDSGVSYHNGASDYLGQSMGISASIGNSADAALQAAGGIQNVMQLNPIGIGNNVDESLSASLFMHHPTSGSPRASFNWFGHAGDTGGYSTICNGAGGPTFAASITNLQFFFSTGNVAAGEFKLFAIRDTIY